MATVDSLAGRRVVPMVMAGLRAGESCRLVGGQMNYSG